MYLPASSISWIVAAIHCGGPVHEVLMNRRAWLAGLGGVAVSGSSASPPIAAQQRPLLPLNTPKIDSRDADGITLGLI
jgi:hypothetical protein